MKRIIHTEKAPAPVGPYNQAIEVKGLVFTAGQIALDPRTNQLVEGDVQAQTRQVLENLSAVLQAAGSGLQNVIKTTVYLEDMGDFAAMNAVYSLFFSEASPARSTVEVSRLPKDARVEIDCIAFIDNKAPSVK